MPPKVVTAAAIVRQEDTKGRTALDVVFHLGAHCTDEDRLLRGLLKGRETLLRGGVAVPAPGRYRNLLRQAMMPLKGRPASPGLHEALVDTITDADDTRRLILSHDSFLCLPARVFGPGGPYTMAGAKAAAYANLFPGARITFLMALVNPATLIPALAARLPDIDYETLMNGCDPRSASWIPVIAALREAVPAARLVVWCHEDAPVIWPEILRAAAGPAADLPLAAGADLASSLLTPAGAQRLADHMRLHPPADASAFREVLRDHLSSHAAPGALDIEIGLPGWNHKLIADLTANYDRDCDIIGAIDGVETIQP